MWAVPPLLMRVRPPELPQRPRRLRSFGIENGNGEAASSWDVPHGGEAEMHPQRPGVSRVMAQIKAWTDAND
jgi:hypothetical protein